MTSIASVSPATFTRFDDDSRKLPYLISYYVCAYLCSYYLLLFRKSYLVAAADAPEKYGVAARRADGLLQQWLEWNQTGQISSSPNGRSFSTVLGLYCKDKNAKEESVLRALQILSIMEDLYDETKTRGMRPE